MKKLISFCLVFSFHFAFGQNISVTLYNTTGYDLDSVSFTGTYVGKMAKNDSVTLSSLKEITISGSSTLQWATGIIKGKTQELPSLACGTGSFPVHSGNYKFNLVLRDTDHTGYKNHYTIGVRPHGLQITIFNKTPYDLDSVYIGNRYAGQIKKDSSIIVNSCKELEFGYFEMQGLVPTSRPVAIIEGKRHPGQKEKGKNVYTVTSGYYWLDICPSTNGKKYSFSWKTHSY